ncbi:MAG TPA: CaiB/BaiF CoA-transferase family protein [Stenomitos sp.]
MGPLDGVRVLDLSRLLPGPYCSMLLADYGAEVIKVEDPGLGDYLRGIPPLVEGTSAYFLALNRNKKSLSLNLKEAEGVAILRRLAETADVVLESFRPGVADRLGVGYADLKAVNPRLIYCSLTGYGQTGPLRERSGHDLNYMALAGALAQLRPGAEDLPVLPGIQVADIAGAMYAATSISMALFARERTGAGTYLDVAMLDAAMSWLPFVAARTFVEGSAPGPGATELNGAVARYAVYRTADGKAVALAALEEKFWHAFCKAAGHPEWRQERSEAVLKAALGGFFAERSREEWAAWAEGKDICLEPVLAFDEAIEHPQVRARGLVATDQLRSPVPYPDVEAGPRTPPPRLGEHTEAILAELGIDRAECQSLRERAIL